MDDTKKPGNVSKIDDARKKKRKGSDDKLKTSEVYKALADAIGRSPFSGLPPFPVRYRVLEPENGTRLPLIVADDDGVQVVKKNALAKDILTYCDHHLASKVDFSIKPSQANEAADYYLMTAEPVAADKIRATRWQGEEGLTYRRLPWGFQQGDVTTWEALLSRMSNVQAFIDWVGSLFVEESYIQNYLWIHGLGGDGKGAINRFLSKVFGPSYRSKQSPGSGRFRDKFWTYGLLGARLVVFPDCDDHTFVTNSLFKSLTGGDPVDLEIKGGMSFTANLIAKYMIISNNWPSVTMSPSDLRRIIYCELSAAPGVDPEFEQRLWAEGGAFLTACVAQYRDKYPKHGPIKSDTDEIEDRALTLEEPLEEVLNTWFKLNPEAYVQPNQMMDVVCAEWPRSGTAQQAFRKWIEKRYGIRRVRVRTGAVLSWRYPGLELVKVPPERVIRDTFASAQDH